MILKNGKNLFKVNSYTAIVLIGMLLQFTNMGIVSTTISYLFSIDLAGKLSSLIYITSITGISFAGIFLSNFIHKYQGFRLGIYSAIVASALSFLLIYTYNQEKILFSLIFILSILMGLENPNINSILNSLTNNPQIKEQYFAKFTTYTQIVIIISPIISVQLFIYYGIKKSYLLYLICYLIISTYWFLIKDKISLQEYKNFKITNKNFFTQNFGGYYYILTNLNLKNMTLSRIINNFIFSGVIVLFPYFVARISISSKNSITLQSILTVLVSLGFILNGYICAKFSKNKSLPLMYFVFLVPIIGISCVGILYFLSYNMVSLFFMSFLLGFGQFYFRLSGMLIGQAITLHDILAQVISAGDTIVRISTAIYTSLLVYIVYKTNSIFILFIFSLVSLISPFLLKKSVLVYEKQANNSNYL